MRADSARGKIVGIERLASDVARARRKHESIVFTNGCFDLLHIGHVRSLEAASAYGDRLIVGVNRDASVRRLKGPARPILPSRERMELVAAIGCVDWVVSFGADTPIGLIERIRPDVLAKGGDWNADEIVGREIVEASGGRVVRLPITPGHRTTTLLARIRRGRPRTKR